ncbi:hypothetical protein THAOC_36346, partial [Thalassiosira oceanica]
MRAIAIPEYLFDFSTLVDLLRRKILTANSYDTILADESRLLHALSELTSIARRTAKTPKKTKLSPAEKKDRRRLRDRACKAKKREDPAYLLREAEKKAKKREDSDIQASTNKARTPLVTIGREWRTEAYSVETSQGGELRTANIAMLRTLRETILRDVNCKRTARNEKRNRRDDNFPASPFLYLSGPRLIESVPGISISTPARLESMGEHRTRGALAGAQRRLGSVHKPTIISKPRMHRT